MKIEIKADAGEGAQRGGNSWFVGLYVNGERLFTTNQVYGSEAEADMHVRGLRSKLGLNRTYQLLWLNTSRPPVEFEAVNLRAAMLYAAERVDDDDSGQIKLVDVTAENARLDAADRELRPMKKGQKL